MLLQPENNRTREPPRTLPESKTVRPRLRTLIMNSGPFAEGLLGCLMTPALSALKFTHIRHSNSSVTLRSLLLFVENSSAKLTSLVLSDVKCSLQDFIDLSSLTPRSLNSTSEDSRLIIRSPAASEPMLLDMFHSRLYLAPNPSIVENASPLQHAELCTSLFDDCLPTYFDESDLEMCLNSVASSHGCEAPTQEQCGMIGDTRVATGSEVNVLCANYDPSRKEES
ncbi:hypothetical protein BD779DRAFT_498293 [Infundibulicybe gibba]|nr:hypothetical protein BD779DRAFT_498293 [Infundibulicybe gibba]